MDDENQEVVAAVAELAHEAETAAVSEEVIAAVVEAAEERVEAAERTAEQIAEAALESERGRQIDAIRKDVEKWQSEQAELKFQLTEMKETITTLSGQIAALATLEISSQAQQAPVPILSSSTLPTSETPEPMAEILEVIPESLSESVVAESPVPVEAPKRKRWI